MFPGLRKFKIYKKLQIEEILKKDKNNLFNKIRKQTNAIRLKDKQLKIITKFMTKMKIKYSLEKPSYKNDGYVWNGKTLKIGHLKPSDIAHDIAHYLISKPKDRKKPEFGLGSPIDGITEAQESVRNADACENLASLLGVIIEFNLNLNAKYTFEDQNWTNSYDQFEDTFQDLQKLKLVDKNGKLLCL